MLVRSALAEGHSHVWVLSPTKPRERATFFSEPVNEHDYHSHALIYGGDRGPGNLESELSGEGISTASSAWIDGEFVELPPLGDTHPEQPDSRRSHKHAIAVLL